MSDKKDKPLTDWEAGNELAYICDQIDQRGFDLKESHPEIYKVLVECRRNIASEFNKLEAHGFYL